MRSTVAVHAAIAAFALPAAADARPLARSGDADRAGRFDNRVAIGVTRPAGSGAR